MILKDSWIGLIQTPIITDAVPQINRCNVQVEEIYNATGTYSPTTNADVDISNLDINPTSRSGIYSIKIDMAVYEKQDLYFNQNDYLPLTWTNIETRDINHGPDGITGLDNLVTFILKNIPTHPKGFFHKFRLQFLNNRSLPGNFIYPSEDFKGTMNNNVFTLTNAITLPTDIDGFSFNLLDSKYKILNINPVVPHTIEDDTIVFCSNFELYSGKNITDVMYVRPLISTYYYILGFNGLGVEFDGINDLSEIAGVEGLEAEPYINTWVHTDEYVLKLQTNSLRLRWNNMYNHPSTTDTVMADGSVRNVEKSEWASGEYYVVFARYAKTSTLPVAKYPIDDAFGKWYRIKEISMPKHTIEELPRITTTINDLPREKYIQFFVGVMTDFTSNDTTMAAPQNNYMIFKHDMEYTLELNWENYNSE